MKLGVAALAFAVACAGLVALYAVLRDGSGGAIADRAVRAAASEPLVRSDPGVLPWKEQTVPPPRLEDEPEPPAESTPERRPAGQEGQQSLPVQEAHWPMPSEEQVRATRQPRHYQLPPGAVLGLTIPAIGLYDVPVLRSNTRRALDNGVIHARGTSMPWSRTPERNVYLAGHRLGWPGTGSHLVFYQLDELGLDDQIVLKSRDGGRYRYRVTATFAVRPDEVWVTGRIAGRDMLTLQTCTPIPGFQKRLIVRAERI